MTGELAHTTSKKKMAPELMFSSERVPQLSITDSKVKWSFCFPFQLCSARYITLQTKSSIMSTSAINPVTTEKSRLQTRSLALRYRE